MILHYGPGSLRSHTYTKGELADSLSGDLDVISGDWQRWGDNKKNRIETWRGSRGSRLRWILRWRERKRKRKREWLNDWERKRKREIEKEGEREWGRERETGAQDKLNYYHMRKIFFIDIPQVQVLGSKIPKICCALTVCNCPSSWDIPLVLLSLLIFSLEKWIFCRLSFSPFYCILYYIILYYSIIYYIILYYIIL